MSLGGKNDQKRQGQGQSQSQSQGQDGGGNKKNNFVDKGLSTANGRDQSQCQSQTIFIPEGDESSPPSGDDPSDKRRIGSSGSVDSSASRGSTSGVSSGSGSQESSTSVLNADGRRQGQKEGKRHGSRAYRGHGHLPHHPPVKRLRHVSTAESDDSDESSTLEREAPDGGYGWVVVAVAFLVNLIADGVTFSFGVYLPVIQKEFASSIGGTSFVGSLLASMPLLSGPVASTLTDRYGCKKVTIVGGALAALGFIMSYFVESLTMLMITFGVITGFGLSLCYVAAVVIVAYYFDKKRSFATGLSSCGGGLGTFIYGLSIAKLIDLYTWRPTLIMISGCFLILCVCGFLMKDLEWTKRSSRKKEKVLQNEHDFNIQAQLNVLTHGENALNGLKSNRLCNSALCIPTFVREQQRNNNTRRLNIFKDFGDHRNSLTYRGAVLNLKRTYRLRHASSCPDIISVGTNDDKNTPEWKDAMIDIYLWMKEIFAWDNLCNLKFLMFIISNFLLYTWYDIPFTFLTDTASKLGYTEQSAAVLSSVIGLFTVVGNIGLGYIGDKKWANSVVVYGVCLSICGVMTALMPIFFTKFDGGYANYYGLCVLCGIFGTMIAANYSLTPVILLEVVSLDRFANAYGLLLLVQGVGNLIGPPIAGAIYDKSGSYNLSFWLAGGGIILSNLFILVPIYKKYQAKRNLDRPITLEIDVEKDNEDDSDKQDDPLATNAI